MKAVQLVVEPFEFLNLLNFECYKEFNHHGILKIKGIISEDNADAYMKKAAEELWVCIKIKEEEIEEVFFYGVLTQIMIHKEGNIFTMTIELKTGSYLMDRSVHIRSFQDNSISYESVINNCIENSNEECIFLEKENEKIGRLLIQYKETNWGFAKRQAGYLNTVIMPEFATKGKRFFFGCDGTKVAKAIQLESYYFHKGYNSYITKESERSEMSLWLEQGFYIVQSREIYKLGEPVMFHGKKYLVGKIITQLVGQELSHEYYLVTASIADLFLKNNSLIRGISLKATVKKVEKDKVQIVINEDENKANCKYRWFDYATVYSTPDGTGWYCMPEIGDEVRLTIPDDIENNAYVSSSVHLETSGGRIDPSQKSWKNSQGKEVLFTPECLVLRNNKGLIIELSDQEGISILSDKNITIQAGEHIDINSSNAEIKMNANNQISIAQGSAKILMKDNIDIYGGKINMN